MIEENNIWLIMELYWR